MNKKKTSLSSSLWLIVVIVAMVGLAVFSLSSVQAKEKQMDEPNKTAMMEEKMTKCNMKCVKNCQEGMEDILAAKAVIIEAVDFINKGDMDAAKEKLEKAQKILAKVHERMKENIEKMPCANIKCPMTGNPIDKMEVPMEQTRMFKGMKIGFCGPGCPAEWDKLTDAEKDAKLKECMPPKKE